MRPVRTAASNMVYTGPTEDIGDLHCERRAWREDIPNVNVIHSVWYLDPKEREAIANGANIGLDIVGEPIPPSRIYVVQEEGVGEDAPEVLARLAEYRELEAERK